MPKFPFTNYHELNLDWILKKVNALFDASEENAQTIRTYNTRLTAAEQTATNANTAATAAQQLAYAASENADDALAVAGTADSKADSAMTAATTAVGAAAGAMTTAQEARQIAGSAQSAAADAGAVANDASNAAAAAQQTADTNAGNIANLQTAVDTLSSSVTEIDNKADVIIDSASGSIASFADGANDMPIRSLVVNIEPVQAGSGDPSPTNVRPITGHTGISIVRTGKNFFNIEDFTRTVNNVTATYQNGYFTVTGQGAASFVLPYTLKPDKNIIISTDKILSTNANNIRVYITRKLDQSSAIDYPTISEQPYIINNGGELIQLVIQTSSNFNGSLSFGIQIEAGSSATSFELPTPTTVNVSWQSAAGTVYGGTLDVINGVLTVNRAFKQYTGTAAERWTYSSWTKENTLAAFTNVDLADAIHGAVGDNYMCITACNRLPLTTYTNLQLNDVPGITITGGGGNSAYVSIRVPKTIAEDVTALQTYLASNPLEIVYELATPLVYQLTGQQINTLLGSNNIYSDVGSITVQYPADTKLYIDGKIAELQALVLEN